MSHDGRLCCAAPTAHRTGESAIEPLNPAQRAHLKSLAHPLRPILQIGKDGVSKQATAAVREAFNTRELLKVKVLDSAPHASRETGEELVSGIDNAHLVQVIGRTLVLYRPDPENPRIELPGA